MMSARFGLRATQALRHHAQTQMRIAPRRWQSSTTTATPEANQSYFTKLWNSEVGPKTVHFWAPIMKWGVVLAGAADFARPASSLSISQNVALMITGLLWTRWCFIIKPRNIFLASVNFALFTVGLTQVTRVILYQRSLPKVERAQTELGAIERVAEDPKKMVDVVQGKKV